MLNIYRDVAHCLFVLDIDGGMNMGKEKKIEEKENNELHGKERREVLKERKKNE